MKIQSVKILMFLAMVFLIATQFVHAEEISANAKPDVAVDKIYIKLSDHLTPTSANGDFCVDVSNRGQGGSPKSIVLDFYVPGFNIKSQTEIQVPEPGHIESHCVYPNWYVASTGTTTVIVTLDPDKRIDETDVSNNTLTNEVAAPPGRIYSVKLLSPNSGTYSQGSTMEIRWQTEGMKDTVDLYYVGIPYDPTKDYLIAKDVPNTGSYTWTVHTPQPDTLASRIKLVTKQAYIDVLIPWTVSSENFVYFTRTSPMDSQPPLRISTDVITPSALPTVVQTILPVVITSPVSANVIPKVSFVRNLSLGASGADVKALQSFLNTHGYPVTISNEGSKGFETNYFGLATKAALIKFQLANNISPAVGFFGPITRQKVSNL